MGWPSEFGSVCDGKELSGGVEVLFYLDFGGGFDGVVGGEKKKLLRWIVLSTQCFDWLASTLKILLGFLGDQDFVKSFREGSKLLIAHRGENKAGQFLEAAAFGLGGRKGFILIPEGHRGWGWHKFSGVLKLVPVSLFASVDPGNISLNATVKQEGPSYGAVLRSFSDFIAKELPFKGGCLSGLRVPLAELCALDLFPALRSTVPKVSRTVVDCSILGLPLVIHPPGKKQAPIRCSSFDPTNMGLLLHPLGKKKTHTTHFVRGAVSTSLNSNLHMWFRMFLGFNLALGLAIGKFLGCAAGPDSGSKHKRVRLGRVLPKPKPLVSLKLDSTKIAGLVPSTSLGCSSRLKSTSPLVSGDAACRWLWWSQAKFQPPSRSVFPLCQRRSCWFRCLWLLL
ncbi:uncharacterized protein LOC133857298 isoform X1 [Alnus glutinosa]|uniref:uncharacterized protein LOC133857298 isoform X1 n=1 Tax=Alnus glutinosa TaxID=3517 RepID=UPI002D77DACA|nr:uncharacterized protein LOC133857298 isoform X1 [Alnus glutinosa]